MRVLLDACVPRRLGKALEPHEARTAPEVGWGDLDNGDLLDAMGADFDALITVDRRLAAQHDVANRAFGIVVLRAKSNRLADFEPLLPETLEALARLTPGTVAVVSGVFSRNSS